MGADLLGGSARMAAPRDGIPEESTMRREDAIPRTSAFPPRTTKPAWERASRGARYGEGKLLLARGDRGDRADDLAVDVGVLFVCVQPDDVLSGAAVEDVDLVVMGERVEDVVSVASVLDVEALSDEEPVVAAAAVDVVISGPASDEVVAVGPVQYVIARAAVQKVVAGPAVGDV